MCSSNRSQNFPWTFNILLLGDTKVSYLMQSVRCSTTITPFCALLFPRGSLGCLRCLPCLPDLMPYTTSHPVRFLSNIVHFIIGPNSFPNRVVTFSLQRPTSSPSSFPSPSQPAAAHPAHPSSHSAPSPPPPRVGRPSPPPRP